MIVMRSATVECDMEARVRSEVVSEASNRLAEPVPVSKLCSVRADMSALMDRVAGEILARRLDLDDCVVERYAVVRPACGQATAAPSDGATVDDDALIVPLRSMVEPEALVRAYAEEYRRVTGRTAADGPLVIVGLKLRAVRMPDYPDRGPANLATKA